MKGEGISGIQKLSLQGPEPVPVSLEEDEPAGRWGRRQGSSQMPSSRRSPALWPESSFMKGAWSLSAIPPCLRTLAVCNHQAL